MRVFNETKTKELISYDLSAGYLKDDKLFVAHHEASEGTEGITRYEVLREYPNGGRDLKLVTLVEPIPPKPAYDEYEDIKVYIPYSAEEIEERKSQKYATLVDALIRVKYTLSAELALLRQRDEKPGEFAAYNMYAEECKIKARMEVYGA